MSEQANVEVSQEMEQFISYVEKLSVLELSKLVKALEEMGFAKKVSGRPLRFALTEKGETLLGIGDV